VGSPGTRTKILDAARKLIALQHPSALSVAEIARHAGISHRTVYRYFSTKEALITAVAEHPAVPELALPERVRHAEAAGMLRLAWRHLGGRLDELRGERMVPGGLELRRARLKSARSLSRAILSDAGVPRGRAREQLVEIVTLLTSSSTLLELVDRHGHDVDTAVDLVLDAVERLIASAVAPRKP
jgi:AcrR family transcriptional regulator